MTLNELVKLTTLWTTGPDIFGWKKEPYLELCWTPYPIHPKILTSILLTGDASKYCCMSGKQYRSWSETVFCSILIRSALFAPACQSKNFGGRQYDFIQMQKLSTAKKMSLGIWRQQKPRSATGYHWMSQQTEKSPWWHRVYRMISTCSCAYTHRHFLAWYKQLVEQYLIILR